MTILFLILFYMFPALVAYCGGKRNRFAILVLNLFLGWTFIGWVIALIWAVVKDETK